MWKTLIGFNLGKFDLPVLSRRCLYLGVDMPPLQISRFRHPDYIDLQQVWTMDDLLPWRSLKFISERLGVSIPDPISGADVPELAMAGRWDDIIAHCKADVLREHAVAQRLKALPEGRAWVVLDLETAPIPEIAQYIGDIKVPKSYKNPETIEKYKAEKEEDIIRNGALDPDLCRIVCAQILEPGMTEPKGWLAKNEDEEMILLRKLVDRLQVGRPVGQAAMNGEPVIF